jgi:hypothetical protein
MIVSQEIPGPLCKINSISHKDHFTIVEFTIGVNCISENLVIFLIPVIYKLFYAQDIQEVIKILETYPIVIGGSNV